MGAICILTELRRRNFFKCLHISTSYIVEHCQINAIVIFENMPFKDLIPINIAKTETVRIVNHFKWAIISIAVNLLHERVKI